MAALIRSRAAVPLVMLALAGALILAPVPPSRAQRLPIPAAGADFEPGVVLATFRGPTPAARRLAAVERAGLVVDPAGSTPYFARLRVPRPDHDLLGAVRALLQDPVVVAVQPNYRYHATGYPNDPFFGQLWGLDNTGQTGGVGDADIDAPEAWERATGSQNVVVAVIDTGVDYNHEDLAANIWTNAGEVPANGIDDDRNGYVDDLHGYDFANNDANPMDDHSHGTHCAGTIAARGNNGIGVVGVSQVARIMALKFMTRSGSGYTSDAVRAIDYGIRNGARVLSNSWASYAADGQLLAAIQRARDAGVLFAAAASNEANNNDTRPAYPASYSRTTSNVVAVAATDAADRLASFSNFGALSVDLAAPGVSILSTTPGNSYARYSGTSMAAPHVAGAAALLLASSPALTLSQLKDRLLSSVDPLGSLAGRVRTGGRLNVNRALTGFTPPPLGPDSYEVDDTAAQAKPIAAGDVQNRSLHVATDVDWATFTLAIAADISLETSGASGDTELELWRGAARVDYDNDGNGRFSRITATALAAGVYHARVQAFQQQSAIPAYTLRLAVGTPPPAGDAWEPDNSAAAAKAVQLGTVTVHTFHQPGDLDWVKFTIAKRRSVTLSTSALTGSTDTLLELYDKNGTSLLRSNDDGGGGFASLIRRTLPRAGTYYARIREFGSRGGPGFGYSLTVR